MIINNRKTLIAVLAIPILVLLALTVYKATLRATGALVVLPITGYDPRDLLSGHYVTYTVEYGAPNPCIYTTDQRRTEICVDQFGVEPKTEGGCKLRIRGRCEYGRFTAGIERFYFPEKHAGALDAAVRTGTGKIGVRVGPGGDAQVQYLEVEGKRWSN
jgi:uncharacterized membrane-anchored protein